MGWALCILGFGRSVCMRCASMYMVVFVICIFVQKLHLFEYFNVSLLSRF